MKGADLNAKLVRGFRELLSLAAISGVSGDTVDATILTHLRGVCGLKRVVEAEWGSPLWAGHRERVRSASKAMKEPDSPSEFTFSGLTELTVPFLVEKPGGRQEWPDAILLFGRKGLPIEFKSSKNGKVVWNSGLPKGKGVYIYNGSSGAVRGTTFFLGEDIITQDEVQILQNARKEGNSAIQESNDKLRALESCWDFYLRPMHNSSDNVLKHLSRPAREAKLLDYLASFDWS